MAKCKDCKHDMLKVNTCTKPYILINGRWFRRNTSYTDNNDRCHDCNIKNGAVHHFGCDIERCPNCGRQLISCDCNTEKVASVIPGSTNNTRDNLSRSLF